MTLPNLSGIVICLAFVVAPAALASQDCETCKDHPSVPRMPGYNLTSAEERQFDSYSFAIGQSEKKQEVEGRYLSLRYDLGEGKTKASALQIVRNYQNAARNAGGQVMWDSGPNDDRMTTVRFNKGPLEIWAEAHVYASGGMYTLIVIEKQSMQQDLVLDTKAMAASLAESGHVEVPGIFFDFGKSDVKTESEPALKQIAALLSSNPSIKVWVVGHTDAVGTPESNLKLSNARAAAVAAVLTQKHGVAASRLAPYGAGPYAPVATNDTEEGRARNRRVELVSHP